MATRARARLGKGPASALATLLLIVGAPAAAASTGSATDLKTASGSTGIGASRSSGVQPPAAASGEPSSFSFVADVSRVAATVDRTFVGASLVLRRALFHLTLQVNPGSLIIAG